MSADDSATRKQNRVSLRPGELGIEQLAAAFDLVNGSFCIYDREGRVLYMHHDLMELIGVGPDNLASLNIVDLAIDRHKKRIRERLKARMAEGGKSNWELPIKSRDGEELYVIARTSPWYEKGEIAGEILLIEDITELKRTDAQLRESQRRMADVIESLPDATMVIDKRGRIIYWNREMVDLTGYPAKDMVGKDNYEHAIPFYGMRRPILIDMAVDPQVKIAQHYLYIHREGNVLYTETKTGKLKGRERILWGRAAPLFDTKGEIVGAIESVRDITDRKEAEEDLKKSHERLEAIFSGTVSALAVTTEKRDQFTSGHQRRVAALATAIAKEMGLAEKIIEDIRVAATMHNIGQLYVPIDILSKSSRLSDIEMLFVKTHPSAGYDIVKSIPFEGPIAEIILQHHERWDGSGYPRGLSGEKILLEARILAVADVVEAMVSHRPYRIAPGLERALAEIKDNAGRLYDPNVVNACLNLIQKQDMTLPSGAEGQPGEKSPIR
ncbi:MAG: HD domain-containing phosphohydrolase [Syntrophomonadaceae bacterium]